MIAVAPRNTSRTYPECGYTAKENRPTQEKFRCVVRPHRAPRHGGRSQHSAGRAGPSRRRPRVTTSPRLQPEEESRLLGLPAHGTLSGPCALRRRFS
ncbi:hypothetical protein AB0N62_42450 [Streptomyces sp. NPDC093982]|uniref:hypothetical protein n=1 Tax=Streptomyces sp. NPDC093982 TaxID=3155077 RepID=UPI0034201684